MLIGLVPTTIFRSSCITFSCVWGYWTYSTTTQHARGRVAQDEKILVRSCSKGAGEDLLKVEAVEYREKINIFYVPRWRTQQTTTYVFMSSRFQEKGI